MRPAEKEEQAFPNVQTTPVESRPGSQPVTLRLHLLHCPRRNRCVVRETLASYLNLGIDELIGHSVIIITAAVHHIYAALHDRGMAVYTATILNFKF